jgi:hypothetical protein
MAFRAIGAYDLGSIGMRPEEKQPTGWHKDLLYEDTGCEVFDSCLTCPLPRCKYDEPQNVSKSRLCLKTGSCPKSRGAASKP